MTETTAAPEPLESDREHLNRRLHLLSLANNLTDPVLRAAIDAELEAADRLHRQLVAARAEADGLDEAMRNAGRLYGQHLTEERAKAAAARTAALREAAAAIQDVIDRDRAKFPHARSQSRTALGGARELILGLIDPAGSGPTACPHIHEGGCCSGPGYCCHACEPTGEAS
jgi:hypothetical protein